MTKRGIPLLFDEGEVMRLHELARLTALQAGAKDQEPGGELDQLTAQIFTLLAIQTNRAVQREQSRPALRLIEQ